MKKTICAVITLFLGVSSLVAQPTHSHEGKFFLGLQQGPVLSIYENAFSYWENAKAIDLFSFQFGLVAGYDVNDIFGLRLSAAYGKNAGACNVKQTSGGGFYPYTFSSLNVFADAVLDLHGLSDNLGFFRVKLYGGLGYARTFHMTDAQHPWQVPEDPNNAFGFRLGGITEFNLTKTIALYADLCGEGYTDLYNGLMPAREEQNENFEGYGGFPLDLRGLLSIGFLFRF